MMKEPAKKNELHSDAWSRFERAIDVVAKSPPQHRIKGGKSLNKKKENQSRRIKSDRD
jgi:hypothetical protein